MKTGFFEGREDKKNDVMKERKALPERYTDRAGGRSSRLHPVIPCWVAPLQSPDQPSVGARVSPGTGILAGSVFMSSIYSVLFALPMPEKTHA